MLEALYTVCLSFLVKQYSTAVALILNICRMFEGIPWSPMVMSIAMYVTESESISISEGRLQTLRSLHAS